MNAPAVVAYRLPRFDAYVVLDADTIVEPDLLPGVAYTVSGSHATGLRRTFARSASCRAIRDRVR